MSTIPSGQSAADAVLAASSTISNNIDSMRTAGLKAEDTLYDTTLYSATALDHPPEYLGRIEYDRTNPVKIPDGLLSAEPTIITTPTQYPLAHQYNILVKNDDDAKKLYTSLNAQFSQQLSPLYLMYRNTDDNARLVTKDQIPSLIDENHALEPLFQPFPLISIPCPTVINTIQNPNVTHAHAAMTGAGAGALMYALGGAKINQSLLTSVQRLNITTYDFANQHPKFYRPFIKMHTDRILGGSMLSHNLLMWTGYFSLRHSNLKQLEYQTPGTLTGANYGQAYGIDGRIISQESQYEYPLPFALSLKAPDIFSSPTERWLASVKAGMTVAPIFYFFGQPALYEKFYEAIFARVGSIPPQSARIASRLPADAIAPPISSLPLPDGFQRLATPEQLTQQKWPLLGLINKRVYEAFLWDHISPSVFSVWAANKGFLPIPPGVPNKVALGLTYRQFKNRTTPLETADLNIIESTHNNPHETMEHLIETSVKDKKLADKLHQVNEKASMKSNVDYKAPKANAKEVIPPNIKQQLLLHVGNLKNEARRVFPDIFRVLDNSNIQHKEQYQILSQIQPQLNDGLDKVTPDKRASNVIIEDDIATKKGGNNERQIRRGKINHTILKESPFVLNTVGKRVKFQMLGFASAVGIWAHLHASIFAYEQSKQLELSTTGRPEYLSRVEDYTTERLGMSDKDSDTDTDKKTQKQRQNVEDVVFKHELTHTPNLAVRYFTNHYYRFKLRNKMFWDEYLTDSEINTEMTSIQSKLNAVRDLSVDNLNFNDMTFNLVQRYYERAKERCSYYQLPPIVYSGHILAKQQNNKNNKNNTNINDDGVTELSLEEQKQKALAAAALIAQQMQQQQQQQQEQQLETNVNTTITSNIDDNKEEFQESEYHKKQMEDWQKQLDLIAAKEREIELKAQGYNNADDVNPEEIEEQEKLNNSILKLKEYEKNKTATISNAHNLRFAESYHQDVKKYNDECADTTPSVTTRIGFSALLALVASAATSTIFYPLINIQNRKRINNLTGRSISRWYGGMGYTMRSVIFHSIILAKIATDDIFAYQDTLQAIQKAVQTNLSTPNEFKNDPQRPSRFVNVIKDSIIESSTNSKQKKDIINNIDDVDDLNNNAEFNNYPYNELYERYLKEDVINSNNKKDEQQQEQNDKNDKNDKNNKYIIPKFTLTNRYEELKLFTKYQKELYNYQNIEHLTKITRIEDMRQYLNTIGHDLYSSTNLILPSKNRNFYRELTEKLITNNNFIKTKDIYLKKLKEKYIINTNDTTNDNNLLNSTPEELYKNYDSIVIDTLTQVLQTPNEPNNMTLQNNNSILQNIMNYDDGEQEIDEKKLNNFIQNLKMFKSSLTYRAATFGQRIIPNDDILNNIETQLLPQSDIDELCDLLIDTKKHLEQQNAYNLALNQQDLLAVAANEAAAATAASSTSTTNDIINIQSEELKNKIHFNYQVNAPNFSALFKVQQMINQGDSLTAFIFRNIKSLFVGSSSTSTSSTSSPVQDANTTTTGQQQQQPVKKYRVTRTFDAIIPYQQQQQQQQSSSSIILKDDRFELITTQKESFDNLVNNNTNNEQQQQKTNIAKQFKSLLPYRLRALNHIKKTESFELDDIMNKLIYNFNIEKFDNNDNELFDTKTILNNSNIDPIILKQNTSDFAKHIIIHYYNQLVQESNNLFDLFNDDNKDKDQDNNSLTLSSTTSNNDDKLNLVVWAYRNRNIIKNIKRDENDNGWDIPRNVLRQLAHNTNGNSGDMPDKQTLRKIATMLDIVNIDPFIQRLFTQNVSMLFTHYLISLEQLADVMNNNNNNNEQKEKELLLKNKYDSLKPIEKELVKKFQQLKQKQTTTATNNNNNNNKNYEKYQPILKRGLYYLPHNIDIEHCDVCLRKKNPLSQTFLGRSNHNLCLCKHYGI